MEPTVDAAKEVDAADEERAIVRRAKAGDYSAFEDLVRRHERRLYSVAMSILRQREDAENVVQTTFLSVLEHLGEFREEASFWTWVSRIATHAALNVLRKRRGLRTVSLRGGGHGPGHGAGAGRADGDDDGEIP